MSVRRALALLIRAHIVPLVLAVAAGPAQDPTLRVLEPAPDSQIAGSDVTVTVEVEGVELGGQARNGAHLLLTLDALPPLKSLAARFTFRGVDPGSHELRVELRHRDGSAFEPAIVERVRFDVAAADR